jgi:ubiquitin-protein ligase
MNIARVREEYIKARQYFEHIELNPTTDGKVFVKVVLQPSPQQYYIVSIYFPDNYPNELPRVYVNKPALDWAPHRYKDGNICYLHPNMWNPGIHNLSFVIQRTAKWLAKYEIWRWKRTWPGAGLTH